MAAMGGVVDYLCNSFLPHHEVAWNELHK